MEKKNGCQSPEYELIERMKQDDAKAFHQLYNRYSPELYAAVIFLVKKKDIAEEILQELFQRVWERRAYIDTSNERSTYSLSVKWNKGGALENGIIA